jgi:hypothetical protein
VPKRGAQRSPRRIRRAVLTTVLVGLLVACSRADTAAVPPTPTASPPEIVNIEGEVRITGDCPVEPVGESCPDEPYIATIRIERLDGATQIMVTSDPTGRFRVALAPGRYRFVPIQPQPGGPPLPINNSSIRRTSLRRTL